MLPTTNPHALRPYGSDRPHRPLTRFRGRIGRAEECGFRAASHRYHLYVSLGSPRSLRAAVTRDLAGLAGHVGMTVLGPVPGGEGWEAVREAYEVTEHHYDGPVLVPVLRDGWSGRIVSNHAPHIIEDLGRCFVGIGDGPSLCPAGREDEIRALGVLFDEDITDAAQLAGRSRAGARHAEAMDALVATLDMVDRRLAARPYLLGDGVTAADVHLWVTLVHLDAVHRHHLTASDAHRIARRRHVWEYVERLGRMPAFGGNLRHDDIARAHRGRCRGPLATGAGVALVEWPAQTP
jgi:putative glutathione S-transferase